MEGKKAYKPYKKSEKKPEYKPKRGPNDGSGFTVKGSWLKYKQRRGPLSKLMSEEEKSKAEYKPKRGPNDGSGFTVKGSWLKYKQRRGPLSKLMSEEEKSKAGIHELSYDFGCRITRLFQYLTEDAEYKEYVISKQIYRSGTSVGANVRESKHAQSDADFLSKMSIAYKEADETDYWMNLLHDNGYINDEQFHSLNIDNDRILKVLTSIVKTMKQKIEDAKKK